MPGKMTKSNLRLPFRPPQVPAAVRRSRLSCGRVGKPQIFTSPGESSGNPGSWRPPSTGAINATQRWRFDNEI